MNKISKLLTTSILAISVTACSTTQEQPKSSKFTVNENINISAGNKNNAKILVTFDYKAPGIETPFKITSYFSGLNQSVTFDHCLESMNNIKSCKSTVTLHPDIKNRYWIDYDLNVLRGHRVEHGFTLPHSSNLGGREIISVDEAKRVKRTKELNADGTYSVTKYLNLKLEEII
ncbi:hypothetical protein [Pseudoalteromonas denitrificans]|uniref:Lipoprotein n=1 Tax=Pseudoalteromonas denitrificans DSM 6059 TaxID=1123010 RepID=A0A1I1T9P4_9GAMM|nr:hypothetical protein [Pseudoalteromonas denitrificans]SFD55316.1 hypothetical protein SAMN02745724_04833 [Pseudoalteromonas denitrificans DSM 6059]